MSAGSTEGVIYLDHNATTPVAAEVAAAMAPYLREHFANPSSDHVLGRRGWRAVEEARAQVAVLIGAAADEIVFTSGGTESNNLAIFGTTTTAPAERRRIVTSSVEHPATASPCGRLEASGWVVTRVPVTRAGLLDAPAATAALSGDVALCTMLLAQNETGALMPVADLAPAARDAGAVVHADAAQAIGKIPVSVDDLGVDLVSVAGHKVYAPKGVGALYVRRGTPLAPVVVGAGQERGLRPGTENVAGIVGLGAACELARAGLALDPVRIGALRDELFAALSAAVPGLVCHTPLDIAIPNTLYVSFPGVRGIDLLARAPRRRRLDRLGVPRRRRDAVGDPSGHGGRSRGSPFCGAALARSRHDRRCARPRRRQPRRRLPPGTRGAPRARDLEERVSILMNVLVVLNDPPYGTERSYNGLRLAGSLARRDGVEVRVFLFGDAVGCALSNQKVPDGYYHLDRMVTAVVRHGGEIGCCGTCMDARGFTDELLVEGARRSTLEEATDWTISADKVVTF